MATQNERCSRTRTSCVSLLTLAIRQISQQDVFLGTHCLSTSSTAWCKFCPGRRHSPHPAASSRIDNRQHGGRIRECAASKNSENGIG